MIRISILLFATLLAFAQAPEPASGARDLAVTVGKSVLVDSPAVIERVAVGNGALVEAVAVTPHEVLVNGKVVGETTMIVWQEGGNRLFFDLTVQRNDTRLNEVRRQIAEETGDENVEVELNGDSVFLRGTSASITAADRAVSIAGTLGKTVNLMRINIPQTEAQILLKVKFADIDRSVTQSLGLNLISTNPANPASISTGQFSPPTTSGSIGGGSNGTPFTLTQALNVFLFRPDINIGATIQALQSNNLLEILAEPNLLAINGHSADFLSGGRFPYPTIQGGAVAGAVTIAFQEFGIRLSFTPRITPRGTIRLQVQPEVSSLDYSNSLIYNGFTVPGIAVRRMQTEIELDDGQTFVIGGLLNNQDTETLNKIPGLGDIPLLGKLFQSRTKTKSNSELLVLVTPELVQPIGKGNPAPDLTRPEKFLPRPGDTTNTPGVDVTGETTKKAEGTIPVEQLIKSLQPPTQQGTPIQYVPLPMVPAQAPTSGSGSSAPAAPLVPAPTQ